MAAGLVDQLGRLDQAGHTLEPCANRVSRLTFAGSIGAADISEHGIESLPAVARRQPVPGGQQFRVGLAQRVKLVAEQLQREPSVQFGFANGAPASVAHPGSA